MEIIMGNSLQEQFLKLGLAKKNDANKINKQKHKHKKQHQPVQEAKEVPKAEQEKKDYAKLLNAQRAEEQKKKELALQIDHLIAHHKVEEITGDLPYRFTADNKIRKIFISQKIIDQLSNGILAIVQEKPNVYVLVPTEIGRKIGSLDENRLILLHSKENSSEEDDPYSEFEIPDDLMW